MSTTKTLYATRDFKDAGTTRIFKQGEELKDCEAGELLNYQAAGLASEQKGDAATEFMKDGEPKPAKPGTKPAA